VTVEIYDQLYHLSGQDPEHIRELAAIVDAKMRAVAAHGRTADSLRVAVLAALNLADEVSQATSADLQLGHARANSLRSAAGRSAGRFFRIEISGPRWNMSEFATRHCAAGCPGVRGWDQYEVSNAATDPFPGPRIRRG
jgi:cell division protein ZapA